MDYYPGMRIKKIKNFDTNGGVEISRYYYNDLLHYNSESYLFQPNYVTIQKAMIESAGTSSFLLHDFYNINANSVKATYHSGSSNFIYPSITISYGGDFFEKGGKELNFKSYNDYPALVYNMGSFYMLNHDYDFSNFVDYGTNHASYQNSMLDNETIFDSSKRKLKTVKYNYVGTLNTLINNIIPHLFAIRPISSIVEDYVFLMYQTKSYKYRLTSTETIERLNNSIIPITTTITNSFDNPDKVSLPSSIETTNSNGDTKRTNLYYPSDIGSIEGLSSTDIANLNLLQNNKHNLAQIVKTESLHNGDLLDVKQITFANFQGNILPSIIKSKKGSNPFEDRVEFLFYNYHGKPTLVSMKDGTKTRYAYNNKEQVVLKIENIITEVILDDGVDPNTTPCYYQNQYPSSKVTQYEYDPLTNNLISITDPKCDKTTYHYDSFGRLQSVKDKDGNILSENEYHYKP
jgi:YD repeat-containing protein